jgi:hypothetical protein
MIDVNLFHTQLHQRHIHPRQAESGARQNRRK